VKIGDVALKELVSGMSRMHADEASATGWAKFMEWKYPDVEVVFTSPRTFKAAGAIEAAASL